jgi:hypothetical protein
VFGVRLARYTSEKGYHTCIFPLEVRHAEWDHPAESCAMWPGEEAPGLVGEVRAGAVWWYA